MDTELSPGFATCRCVEKCRVFLFSFLLLFFGVSVFLFFSALILQSSQAYGLDPKSPEVNGKTVQLQWDLDRSLHEQYNSVNLLF